jgi:hypothetical protein
MGRISLDLSRLLSLSASSSTTVIRIAAFGV